MLSIKTMDDLFASPLRGDVAPWPSEGRTGAAYEAAKRRLFYHGIVGLLNERRQLLLDWPEALLKEMGKESLARTMWELMHAELLKSVTGALHAEGINSALLKGTALAYSLYENPAHRFRGDSDLLVSVAELSTTRMILARLGWTRPCHTDAPFGDMHFQEIWKCTDQAGFDHDIDLHWEVTNSRALRYVLDVNQVLEDAVPLSKLGPHARCADAVTALLHGCINREAHAHCGYFVIDRNEYDPDRLVWALDFHLLAETLTGQQWKIFLARSLDTGVASICADALAFACKSLGTQIPESVRICLVAAPQESKATRFIRADGGLWRAWADLSATPGMWGKLRFALARTFPSPSHMHAKYPNLERWPTAALHVRRLVEVGLKFGKRRAG